MLSTIFTYLISTRDDGDDSTVTILYISYRLPTAEAVVKPLVDVTERTTTVMIVIELCGYIMDDDQLLQLM